MEEKLRDILPKYYKYKIINLQLGKLDENNFDAIFKVNLFDEIDVKNWLEQFELSSLTNFRVARTAPAKKSRVLFKKYYRCHHNTRAGESASKTKKAHVKHTGCEATLLITVNNAHMKNCKQVDVKRYPCTVKYHNYHNHPLTSDELLCHRKPSQEIEQKIRELLLKNHTPVSALKILKQDLQQEFKDEYSKIVKDGAFCPKLQWVYHQYYSIFKDTCPYKVKYFPTEFLIEESIDGNSDAEMGTEVVQVEHSRPSSPANSHLTSEDFDDITYEEFILSPEDNSLLESHFVEVYTMDDNKMIKEENDIFISENDIADLQVMEEVVPAIDDETSSDHVNAVTNEEIINVIKNEPLANEPCSTLWNSENIEQKDTELNEDDLNDIFGEACHDLNGDIFLPRMNKYKNKIDTSDEDET